MIYLNNATTGFPYSERAMLALQDSYLAPPADLRHTAPEKATLPTIRKAAAHLLGLSHQHLFFTPDATLGINAVLRGYLNPEDHAVVDNRAHNAVTRTLHNAELEWRYADIITKEESVDSEALLDALRPETRLVSLTHASNVTGSIYDLLPVIEALREKRPEIAVLIDACQSAGVADLSPLLEAADFLVFSGHKFLHAPQGASILVAKRRLKPVLFGGTGVHSERLELDTTGDHFVEIGTPNLPAIQALLGALEESMKDMAAHQAIIQERVKALWKGLGNNPSLIPLGRRPGEARTGVIACATMGASPEAEWMPMLRPYDLVVRGGLHCAPRAHHDLGHPEGTLRLSVSRFTTAKEVDEALMILKRCARKIARARKAGASPGAPASASAAPATLDFTVLRTHACTQLEGKKLLQGVYQRSSEGEMSASLLQKGWRVTPLGDETLFGNRKGIYLYLYRDRTFALTHAPTAKEARDALRELGSVEDG